MNSQDKAKFASALKRLQVATGGNLDDDVVVTYWDFLKDYEFHEIATAFDRLARTSKWFPKVADVLAELNPKQRQPEQDAADAWVMVMKFATDGASAVWKCRERDPIALKAVGLLGGFGFLGERSPAENHAFNRGKFIEEYVKELTTTTSPIEREAMTFNDETAKRVIDSTVAGLLNKPGEPS